LRTTAFVEFKVFTEGHRKALPFRVYPQDGHRFTPNGIETTAASYMSSLQDQFPLKRFKAIRTGFNRFNIVHEVGNA
jgi:hypothetical protein